MWSEHIPDTNNLYQFNTIQIPGIANGIGIYGGTNNTATDCIISDTIDDGSGIQVKKNTSHK